uniref:Uncharacterized protein n=1 Tax=Cannabis sativa TaxID=3483 RepID=A0A803R388_CANSA
MWPSRSSRRSRDKSKKSSKMTMTISSCSLSYSWNFVELYVGDDKLIWPENLPKNLKNLIRYPLVNWKHLRLNIHFKLKYESDLKETLMWISPSLESLSINKNVIF